MTKFKAIIIVTIITLAAVFVSGCADGGTEEKIEAGPITFTDEEGHTLVDSSHIEKAVTILGGSEYAVELIFTEEGRAAFAKATEDNIGRKIFVKVGKQLISEAEITEKLDIDKCVIRGNYTKAKADEIVDAINRGLSTSKADEGDNAEDKPKEENNQTEKTAAPIENQATFTDETPTGEIGEHIENQVTFTDENGTVLLNSNHIEKVSGVENNGQYGIKFEFTAEGRRAFADATANNIGRLIYVKLGDRVMSKISISEQIDSDICVVTGSFTKESLKETVDAINERLKQ